MKVILIGIIEAVALVVGMALLDILRNEERYDEEQRKRARRKKRDSR